MGNSRGFTLGCVFGFFIPILIFVALYVQGVSLVRQLIAVFVDNRQVVDFREHAPTGSAVSDVRRLDTNGDGEEEWFVCYQYDLVGARNPVSCAVYHLEGTGPFVIHPYLLRVPANDYLGQLRADQALQITLEDILQDRPGAATPAEIILTDGTTLSIFGVTNVEPRPVGPCIEYPNPYQCLGFFKASLRVTRQGNVISVWDRAGSERSQFALKRVYRPSQGQYFHSGTEQLLSPVEASIEFAYGMPSDILDTPYPEKLVLAFYNQLLPGDVRPYLTDVGRQRFNAGQLDYGSPWSTAQTTKVLVQEISYTDTQADVAQVRVKARFWGPGNEVRLRETLWHVVREGTRWKLHEAASKDVT